MSTSIKDINILLLGFNQNHYGICKNFIDGKLKVEASSRENNYLKKSRLPVKYFKSIEDIGPENFFNDLISLGKKNPKKYFLVPGTDTEVDFLINYEDELLPYFFCSMPKKEKFKTVTDKFLIQDCLKKNGFNYPETVIIDQTTDFSKDTIGIDFPLIIKPAFAGAWKSPASLQVVGEHKVLLVHNLDQLRSLWHSVRQISPRLIAQSIIQPEEKDIYSFCSYSDRDGRVLHGFVTQKLIQYPEGFGTALLCRTIFHPEVYDLGKRVIEGLGVDGVCETEIIRDARTGELFIIEINTRHWMQHRLSTRLGVNYSLLDFYYRTGNTAKVQELLSNQEDFQGVIWFDDVGYLIYLIKNLFHPEKCKLRDVFYNKWELSLFSLSDWRPFAGCVSKKVLK